MKYIIMCGGRYAKWETPRQLLQIKGETIVHRTIRLLREKGVTDIAISASDARFEKVGVPVLRHDNDFSAADGVCSGAWVHAFFPTNEPACYLMGDVYFSPEAIAAIVQTETDDVLFFGSAPPFSPFFIKDSAEPFAFKVVNQRRFRAAVDFVAASVDAGIFRRHPIAWELWQVLIGRNVREIDYDTVTAINDYSCDVDDWRDLHRLEAVL